VSNNNTVILDPISMLRYDNVFFKQMSPNAHKDILPMLLWTSPNVAMQVSPALPIEHDVGAPILSKANEVAEEDLASHSLPKYLTASLLRRIKSFCDRFDVFVY